MEFYYNFVIEIMCHYSHFPSLSRLAYVTMPFLSENTYIQIWKYKKNYIVRISTSSGGVPQKGHEAINLMQSHILNPAKHLWF